jgi:hypothetical protein
MDALTFAPRYVPPPPSCQYIALAEGKRRLYQPQVHHKPAMRDVADQLPYAMLHLVRLFRIMPLLISGFECHVNLVR